MSRYFTADLAGLDPYTPGEQPQGEIRMKLNTNENPFPPSPRVAQAITREQIDSLRYIRPDIRVAGVLVNQWHRSPVVEDAAAYLREDGRVPVYDTVIRRTDKVPESSWARMAVQQWSPWCSAARDYRAWTAELLAKEGMKYE